MSSLATCLRKAGKALDRDDAAAIRDIYNDLTAGGVPAKTAATQAMSEYISSLNEERAIILDSAASQGAVPSPRVMYSRSTRSPEVSKKLSIVDMLYGKGKGKMIEGMSKDKTIKDLARILSARARKLNNGKAFSARTPRNKDILSDTIALETEAAMQQTNHAGDWYSQVLRDAIAAAGTLHPEINTDDNALAAFIFGMAITSNGMSVQENTKYAEKVYSSYKKKGKFPAFGAGAEGEAMRKAFKLFNDLKEKWGMNTLRNFLNTEFTVKELKLLGMEVNGENAETSVYGSAIFGPKIGQAFYQNLSGNFNPLTMDRWWMRTWGRMVGNLAPEGLKNATDQIDRFMAAVRADPAKVESMGFTVGAIEKSDKRMMSLAVELHKKYAQGNFKDKSEINMAAKILDTRVNFPVVAPRNGTERSWIREVVAETQRKLAEKGIPTDTASLQALLWYPEKDFYSQNGVSNERAKPTDYATEVIKLARERGVADADIERAIAAARARRSAGGLAPAEDTAGQEGRGPALTREERTHFLQDAAIRFVRELDTPYVGRVPKGSARLLNGAPVIQVHKLAVKAKNKFEAAGIATPEFRELAPAPESAKLFNRKLNTARKAMSSPTVGPRTQEELEGMRLFLTPDGLAGFAIDGDNIVSLFKHPKAKKEKGVAYPALLLATHQGGRTLNTLDTYAPHLYAKMGFVAASRVPWAMGPKPARVKGDPDYLYMVYDRSHHVYGGEGKTARTTVAAERMQQATRDALEPTASRRLMYSLKGEPNTPLNQLNKLSRVINEQANNPASSGSVVSWLKGKSLGKNAANIERMLSLLPRRNLKDFVRGNAMPSVDEYLLTANRMDGRANELMEVADDLGKRWSRYTSKNKESGRLLGELMHSATLMAVDPSKAYKSLKKSKNMSEADKALDAKRRDNHRVLVDYWNKLDAEGQAIFNEVRDGYAKQRMRVEAALEKRINEAETDETSKKSVLTELRKQFEAGRVSGPYFPLARFGELWAAARDENGEVIAFSKFEKLSDRRDWAAALRAEGFDVETGKQLDSKGIIERLDPKFVAKVTEMAKGVDPSLADEIWQLYLRNMPEMSMRKAFIHRKGRLGFSNNAIRAFGNAMFHGSHQISKLEYGHLLEGQLDVMKEEVRGLEKADHPDELWGNAIFREMKKRHDMAMNPTQSTLTSKLTALGFAWYLGATPAAAVVNLSQTAIVAFPVLAAEFSWAGAGLELNKAATLWAGTRGNVENRLRGDERAAMDEARKVGVFSKTQGHDLAGLSEGAIDYDSVRTKAMTAISWMFHKAEQANREITFLAGYRLARKKGISHEDAIVKSENLVWDSHFDYNSTNRPRIMQNNYMRVILLFRQYSLNMTYRLARDFRETFLPSDAPKAERVKAAQRLGGMMMMTGMFAGALGQPMSWAISGVLDALLGDEDEPFDSEVALRVYLTELYGSKAAEAILKGPVDAYIGPTMSSRVSLSHLWVREAPEGLEGARLYAHYLGEAAGPVLSIPKDIMIGASEMAEGQVLLGAERLMPKAVKDSMKALRYLSEGVQNKRGDVILDKEEMSKKDIFFQSIGFTPAKLTMQYEQNRAVGDAAKKIQDRRSSLMDRLFLSWRMQDKGEAKDTMAAIQKFNKVNPGVRIDVGNIIASGKSRARYTERSVGGVTLPPGLSHLHRKNKFTPEKAK